ncbi:MAG: ester cyclase [Anaerolineae bacterium]
MSTEENKTIVRQYFASWGTTKMLAPNFVAHMPGIPEPMDREAFVQYQGALRAAFPDLTPTVEDQIAADDKVTNRLVFRGTHQGDFHGILPTGRRVAITAITIERVEGGKIAEHWINFDALGIMQQLGVIPTPEQSGV